ncbi:MAG: FRG domain-containing protein [Mycetocola sp.]
MNDDQAELLDLNIRIGTAEAAGDQKFFDRCLAPAFAMSRANGKHETRDTFLDHLRSGPPRSTTDVSASLLGANRATVTCLVAMDGRQYENHRVFVRESSGSKWKLLSWANELVGSSGERSEASPSRLRPIPGVYGLEALTEWNRRQQFREIERDLSHTKHDSGEDSLKVPIPEIYSYEELANAITFLAVMNKNLTLLFRGQINDRPLMPSLYRRSWPANAQDERAGRLEAERGQYWSALLRVEKQVVPILQRMGLPRYRHIERDDIRYARWAVIQHYELWPTPMLDFSSSLRVAASFAFGPGASTEGYLYVTGTRKLRSDLMPLRPKIKDDTAEQSDGVLAIRLNSVCPPSARRPHVQEGALLSSYPIDEASALDPARNDFSSRIIAMFKVVDNGSFWSQPDFPCHTQAALLPQNDALDTEFQKNVELPVIV